MTLRCEISKRLDGLDIVFYGHIQPALIKGGLNMFFQ